MTDRYVLIDENGTVLSEKALVEHIKVFLDKLELKEGSKFTVKSEVTGYVLEITEKTTQEEWRAYADKCLMALD